MFTFTGISVTDAIILCGVLGYFLLSYGIAEANRRAAMQEFREYEHKLTEQMKEEDLSAIETYFMTMFWTWPIVYAVIVTIYIGEKLKDWCDRNG